MFRGWKNRWRWQQKPVLREPWERTAPVEPEAVAEPVHVQRTQVPDAPYLLPKDEEEDRRLNFQHHILYRVLSNHYLAPLTATSARMILDVGTGTGIWLSAMRGVFPEAQLIGVDVALTSLARPLPARCAFVQANILNGLPFADEQFTFTHQRLLVAGIPARQWGAVVRELVRVTAMGGWVELVEISDDIQNAGPATKRLMDWMAQVSQGVGFDVRVVRQLGPLLRQAGCQQVEAQVIPVPLGEWGGPVGQMMKTDVLASYEALKDRYCAQAQTPPETVDGMIQAAAEEWERRHCAYPFHAAYGRRT